MSRDIVPELSEKIECAFKNETAESKIIREKIEALKNKTVTHKDSNAFAIELGNILAEAFKGEINADVLPDNRMYYNIAKRLIEPNLTRNYDLVSNYGMQVQEVLNGQANLSIKAVKPELNRDRIDGIVKKISEYEDIKDGLWLLNEPVINFTQSVVDATIKANADFQHKAGLQPKIIRKESGHCCDWCKNLVGEYDYPQDVPDDVWRRHRYCRCTVEHFPGDGRKRDVWSKKWSDIEKDDKIKKRKNKSNSVKNFKIKESQFGKKAKKHMKDFGLDVKKSSDRIIFERKIRNIVDNHDSMIRDIEWRGQTEPVIAYVKNNDVVLANKNNEFITIMKGGVNNARIKDKGR